MLEGRASMLEAYAGRWHVVASNFGMWLKGNREHPSFNYRVVSDDRGAALDDRVTYFRRGRERVIAGISRPLDAGATQFLWRGRGLLSPLRSHWQCLWPAGIDDVAVIVFDRTLVTRAGADILSRTRLLPDDVLERVLATMSHHPDAAPHAGTMRRLPKR
jgi:hypothetical protein